MHKKILNIAVCRAKVYTLFILSLLSRPCLVKLGFQRLMCGMARVIFGVTLFYLIPAVKLDTSCFVLGWVMSNAIFFFFYLNVFLLCAYSMCQRLIVGDCTNFAHTFFLRTKYAFICLPWSSLTPKD